jgi:hypothetical protein
MNPRPTPLILEAFLYWPTASRLACLGMATGETRIVAWERWLEWPLTALAVIFLGLYAFEVLDSGSFGHICLTC